VGASAGLRWLVKPRRGGGGRGISAAAPGRDPGPDEILQEIVEGPVMSLAFVADGAEVRPLAISAEIAERAAFGGPGLAYVGSVSRPPEDVDETSVREQALCAAGAVTRAFGLRGWNGMDFVLRRGEVVPLEINPRHTSSMDLWDEPGARLFAAHAEACRGRLCGTWLSPPPETRGKAILYARRAVRVGESRSWLGAAGDEGSPRWPERAVADVPHPGERIEGGQPVCSLYAAAPSPAECLAALRDLAARAERDLAPAEAPAPGGRTAASGAVATAASAEPRRPHRAATSPPEERR
jgi:predicted ATP-grasp superfamily ATP-dependent carboligase